MSKLNSKIAYTALTRMTEDRAVIKEAFQHWLKSLGDKPLDVFESVELIETFLGLSTAEKKILMVSMHSASSKSEAELPKVPAFILDARGEVEAQDDDPEFQAVDNKTPHVILSEGYFYAMVTGVQRSGGKYDQELHEILLDEGLPEASSSVQAALKQAKDTRVDLPRDLNDAECQTFCHELYMLVCDIVGPIAADDLSYKAIAQLLETNEASRYDPKKLI